MTFKPLTNNLKKYVASLKNKNFREETGMFTAEGEKLCRELLDSLYTVELIVIRSNPKPETEHLASLFMDEGVPVYIARKQQFDQLCDTKTPQGIMAVIKMKDQEEYTSEPFIALDGISDPGNLGTIIRSVDWFGFKHIILGSSSVDKYNPKTVRSTMGSLFRLKIVTADNLSEYLQKTFSGYEIYGATLQADVLIDRITPGRNFGLVFGNEAYGISDEVRSVLTSQYKIPGFGKAESLNVAVSVAVSLYHFSLQLHSK